MTLRARWNRIKSAFSPITGTPRSWGIDWFQQGLTPGFTDSTSVSYAAIQAYAQTIAQLPAYHIRTTATGVETRVANSPLTKLLQKPNSYQTRTDFLLNLVTGLYGEGNGYVYGNGQKGGGDSTEIYLLHPRSTRATVINGDIYYATGGQWANLVPVMPDMLIPQRFVGHVRLQTPYDPLVGVSPIRAAHASMQAHQAIVGHQAAFFTNMARPSGVLSTELTLKKEQIETLRQAWEDHSAGMNSGQVPILTAGLKWDAMSMTSQDAELVKAWGMTVLETARVFRIPPMLVGHMENATYNNAAELIRAWLAQGLNFAIDAVEQMLTMFFDLPYGQSIKLDHEVLLRTDVVSQMTELKEGVLSGIYTHNEARARRGLAPVTGGDVPFVQSQMIPLEDAANPPEPAPALPAPPPADDADDDDEIGDEPTEVQAMMVRATAAAHIAHLMEQRP